MSEALRPLFGDVSFSIAAGTYRHTSGLTCDISDPAWFTFGGTTSRDQTARAPWSSNAGRWRADLPAAYLGAAGVEGWPAIHAWLQSTLLSPGTDAAAWASPAASDLDAWWPPAERTLRAGASVRAMEILSGPAVLALRVPLTVLPAEGPMRTVAVACLQDWQAQSRMVSCALSREAATCLEVILTGAPPPLEPLVQAAANALRTAAAAILPALESLSGSARLTEPAFMNDVAAWWRDGGEKNNKNRRRK